MQLSAKHSLGCAAKPLAAAPRRAPAARAAPRTVASSMATKNEDVPDMGKRQLMNLLLVGAIGLPGLPLAGGFAYFFVPPSCVPGAPARVGPASPAPLAPPRRARRPPAPRPDAA